MPTPVKVDQATRSALGKAWRRSCIQKRDYSRTFDRARFEAARPTAWALFQGPMPAMTLLVDAATRCVGALWEGHYNTTDPDTTRLMDQTQPLKLFLAAAAPGTDFPPTTGAHRLETWLSTPPPAWTCIAANAAARATTPHRATQAEAAQALEGFTTAWRASMRDPFIDLTTAERWTPEQATVLEPIARDLLLAFGYTTGRYSVESRGPNGDEVTLSDPTDWTNDRRLIAASELLRGLVDTAPYWGQSWHYNDGARDRQSGYTAYPATVCIIDITDASAHARLRARTELERRLDALPDHGRALRHLLPTP